MHERNCSIAKCTQFSKPSIGSQGFVRGRRGIDFARPYRMMIELALALCVQIDQAAVDRAIENGGKYLIRRLKAGTINPAPRKDAPPGGPGDEDLQKDEIVLYTLVYAGVDESEPEFAKLLKTVLESKIESVYRASLQAMALEAIDPWKYQGRIAQCGQFLIDNQCENGQWSYGKEVPLDAWTAAEPVTGTKQRPHVVLKKRRSGPATGDNSNAQYALLGLRACMNAGVIVPAEAFAKAEKWWATTQNKDGGWDYRMGRTRTEHSYGAMTAGGAMALAICRFYLKKAVKGDPAVERGLAWLASNFSVTKHPKFDWKIPAHGWVHYWLYALERAAMLCEREKLGTHDWYAKGAQKLLDAQGSDGAWDGDRDKVTNTCFAILFLRRATKPLKPVPTVDDK